MSTKPGLFVNSLTSGLTRRALGSGAAVGVPAPALGGDTEFRLARGEMTGVRGEAASRIDLLSVIVHESGHGAGLDYLFCGVMAEQLDVIVRRMPVASGWQRDFVNHGGKTDQQRSPSAALRRHLELKLSPAVQLSSLVRH